MSETGLLSLEGPTGMDAGPLFCVVEAMVVDDGFVVVVLPADDVWLSTEMAVSSSTFKVSGVTGTDEVASEVPRCWMDSLPTVRLHI